MRLIDVDIVLAGIGVGSVLVATFCDSLIVTVGYSGRGVNIFLWGFNCLDLLLNIRHDMLSSESKLIKLCSVHVRPSLVVVIGKVTDGKVEE